MGADYRAVLVIGVKLRDVYEEKEVTEYVTRYDELTGKPYEKPNIYQSMKLFGKETDDLTTDIENSGLDLFCYEDYQASSEEAVVGMVIAQAKPYGGEMVEEVRNIEFWRENATRRFESAGYTGDLNIYLIQDVSV